MYTLLIILMVIVAVLMIGIVLIQESKGGGLASAFGSANSLMGVSKTTNFIEKATWTLAGVLVVFSVACAYVAPKAGAESSVIEQAATEQSTTNPNNVQGFGAAQQATPAAEGDKAAATEAAAPAAETPAAAEAPAEKAE